MDDDDYKTNKSDCSAELITAYLLHSVHLGDLEEE